MGNLKLNDMEQFVEGKLLTEEQIARRVEELGRQITEDYRGKELLVLGVLKGCFVFMADLMRAIHLPMTMDFMCIASYGSGSVSGDIDFRLDMKEKDLTGKHVLVVEDILDTGKSLTYVKKLLDKRNAESVKLCVLLDKPHRREAPINADYCGFSIEDRFVIGYGLDLDEQYRGLPYVGLCKPE